MTSATNHNYEIDMVKNPNGGVYFSNRDEAMKAIEADMVQNVNTGGYDDHEYTSTQELLEGGYDIDISEMSAIMYFGSMYNDPDCSVRYYYINSCASCGS